MTEDQVIQGCRRGDREAQRTLYALTSDRVYRLVLRMTRNEDDAFDLAQDAYLRAFERIDQFDGGSTIATWIYQIAMNEALQFLRRRRTHERGLRRHEKALRSELQVEEPDARLDVQEAVARLPDAERALVVLRYFEGFDYAEMGRILGKPPGTIASGLNRARESLRRMLRGEQSLAEET
ncbi:MAG: hypothetical protein AMXMBFR13_39090 [Phycisphaerae bacterium]